MILYCNHRLISLVFAEAFRISFSTLLRRSSCPMKTALEVGFRSGRCEYLLTSLFCYLKASSLNPLVPLIRLPFRLLTLAKHEAIKIIPGDNVNEKSLGRREKIVKVRRSLQVDLIAIISRGRGNIFASSFSNIRPTMTQKCRINLRKK